MTCAKFRCDWLSIFQTRALPILIEFRNQSKYRWWDGRLAPKSPFSKHDINEIMAWKIITTMVSVVCNYSSMAYLPPPFNTLRRRQNGLHFADDIFKYIFLNENVWIPTKISLKFVPKARINNIPALWLGAVQALSHYLNQWWLVYRRIYASLALNELSFTWM